MLRKVSEVYYLANGEFAQVAKFKTSNIVLLHYAVSVITKFKANNNLLLYYVPKTDSRNLMLAKAFCYTVVAPLRARVKFQLRGQYQNFHM